MLLWILVFIFCMVVDVFCIVVMYGMLLVIVVEWIL